VGRNARLAVGNATSSWSPQYSFGPNTLAMPAVQTGLTFGAEARVAGSLDYVSTQAAAGADAVSAHVTHRLPPQDQQLSRELAQRNSASSRVFDALRRLVALLLVGLLIAWLAPRWITTPAARLQKAPLPSLGIGLLGMIAAPITWLVALAVVIVAAVIFGMLSLGGLTGLTLLAGLPLLGLVFVALFFVGTYLCQAIIAYLGGRWILNQLRPDWNRHVIAPTLCGLLILGILVAVPVAGGLLQFVVVLAGLGAIALVLFQGSPKPQVPVVLAAPAETPSAPQS
jgi:hypothetical protein